MTLTKKQSDILDFCNGGKLIREICARFDISQATAWAHLGHLRKANLIEKSRLQCESRIGGIPCIFTTVGTPICRDVRAGQEAEHPQPVPEFDDAIIRAAHNPFNLRAA